MLSSPVAVSLGLLGLFLACLLLVLIWLGVFTRIRFRDGVFPNSVFFWVEHVGPYHKVGPIFGKLFKIQEELLIIRASQPAVKGQQRSIHCTMAGYDDPRKVESAKLRSLCGILVELDEADDPKTCDVTVRSLCDVAKQRIEAEFPGLSVGVREYSAAKAKIVHFPFKCFLSFMLAPMRVYPAAHKELIDSPKHQGCCPVEVYKEKEIEFYFAYEKPQQWKHPKDQ